MKRLRSDEWALYSLLGLVAACPVIGYAIDKSNENHKSLYNQVSLVADTNKNNMTEHEEWARVYKKLNLHYDENSSHPLKELNLEQMKQYLSNY